ncbi:LysR family transcriptional regulator [Stigmatella erecta]|uniref:DNA-binding transcriptional regulator, LysR family n=1 Tax=Stigmatella erecta TaxID=83460 RepID=A0A1I0HUM9_9BACT|nr:LysR family transcriptional regulator [Stigmatella erecta]SET86964.1 DNA-binding transcriptional regulator, LysR family [Stigmatella erecta]
MRRNDLLDLSAFAAVAAEGSFTRAAIKLGMSQSALSHAMKALEQRLGVRLLSRTTRSVAATAAGEELLKTLRPALEGIDAGLAQLGTKRAVPAGKVRLTMTKQAARSVIQPMLPGFLAAYPDIQVEVFVDDRFTDIVTGRFDAGIRFGQKVAKDMVSVRVGPDLRAAVVASPAYLAQRPAPRTPRDLIHHRCINYRMARTGGLYAWEFRDKGRRFEVRVEGSLVFNDGDLIEAAAESGQGIAYIWEDQAAPYLARGRLVRLLEAWCPPIPGYCLYYPSRRQMPPALAAFLQALRSPKPA